MTITSFAQLLISVALTSVAGFALNTYHFPTGQVFSYPDSWTREQEPNGRSVLLYPEAKQHAGMYVVDIQYQVGDVRDQKIVEFLERVFQAGGMKRLEKTEEEILTEAGRFVRTWKMEVKGGSSLVALLGAATLPGNKAMVLIAIDFPQEINARRDELVAMVKSMDEKIDALWTAPLPVRPKAQPEVVKPLNEGFSVVPSAEYKVDLRIVPTIPKPDRKNAPYLLDLGRVEGYLQTLNGQKFSEARVYVTFGKGRSTTKDMLVARNRKPGERAHLVWSRIPTFIHQYQVTRVEIR